jgi:prepilin-type N-terminal cleavage/methylation domain-containing protein/prepilin-type processing-associated H-X9-DG protein
MLSPQSSPRVGQVSNLPVVERLRVGSAPRTNPLLPVAELVRVRAPRHRPRSLTTSATRAFTLVELLVVIGIIAMLMSLALPAINAARESGRVTTCKNNVKQLALAMLSHEASHGRFPSNGWGYRWIGEPDRGTGPEQPGGWIYNILSHLERNDLREVGLEADPTARRAALGQLTQTSLAVLRCPNRLRIGTSPQSPGAAPYNAAFAFEVARNDYAVNEGDYVPPGGPGPATLAEGDDPKYRGWDDTSQCNGISYQRSQVQMGHIRDGASRTYMLGEKYVSTGGYGTLADHGYDQSPFCGEDWDLNRWTIRPPKRDGTPEDPQIFGGPHASGCQMAFCDGSVRTISFSIDVAVHRSLGNRADGKVFDDSEIR